MIRRRGIQRVLAIWFTCVSVGLAIAAFGVRATAQALLSPSQNPGSIFDFGPIDLDPMGCLCGRPWSHGWIMKRSAKPDRTQASARLRPSWQPLEGQPRHAGTNHNEWDPHVALAGLIQDNPVDRNHSGLRKLLVGKTRGALRRQQRQETNEELLYDPSVSLPEYEARIAHIGGREPARLDPPYFADFVRKQSPQSVRQPYLKLNKREAIVRVGQLALDNELKLRWDLPAWLHVPSLELADSDGEPLAAEQADFEDQGATVPSEQDLLDDPTLLADGAEAISPQPKAAPDIPLRIRSRLRLDVQYDRLMQNTYDAFNSYGLRLDLHHLSSGTRREWLTTSIRLASTDEGHTEASLDFTLK